MTSKLTRILLSSVLVVGMLLVVFPGASHAQDEPCFLEDVEDQAPDWVRDPNGYVGQTWTAIISANPKSGDWTLFSEASPANSNKDDRIVSPPVDVTPTSQLNFWHVYSFEAQFDGGVLEVSTDGGNSWADVGFNNFISGGYTATLDTGTDLDGRKAWSGVGPSVMSLVEVDVGPWAGSGRLFRWRLVTDIFTLEPVLGWELDDIEFIGLAGCAQGAATGGDDGSQPSPDNGVGGSQDQGGGVMAETGIESTLQVGMGSALLLLALAVFGLSRRAPAKE